MSERERVCEGHKMRKKVVIKKHFQRLERKLTVISPAVERQKEEKNGTKLKSYATKNFANNITVAILKKTKVSRLTMKKNEARKRRRVPKIWGSAGWGGDNLGGGNK